jgi:CheY-like chemotaxis protein
MARILVLEDDPHLLGAIRLQLEALGHEVVMAANAAEAIERLDETAPDLLLTDLSLAGRSGSEVIGTARRRRPDLPIIAMTAYGEAILNGALRMGAHRALQKPLTRAQLGEAIQACLAATGAARTAHEK